MPGKRIPKKCRIPIRRGAGKRVAKLAATYEEARDRMTALALKGIIGIDVVAKMTAHMEELERFAIRLKIWELGGCKGELPPMPEPVDFASMIPDVDERGHPKPLSVLHVH